MVVGSICKYLHLSHLGYWLTDFGSNKYFISELTIASNGSLVSLIHLIKSLQGKEKRD